jgi:hypothetical protein
VNALHRSFGVSLGFQQLDTAEAQVRRTRLADVNQGLVSQARAEQKRSQDQSTQASHTKQAHLQRSPQFS